MGDRANVVVVPDGNPQQAVYLYTHWGGYALPERLQTALRKHWRWEDEAYLARIIFDTMTDGEHGKETGYGISACLGDNSYPLLVVDVLAQTVGLAKEQEFPVTYRTWSFTDFCELDLSDEWAALAPDNDNPG